jgi:hypothetical protein
MTTTGAAEDNDTCTAQSLSFPELEIAKLEGPECSESEIVETPRASACGRSPSPPVVALTPTAMSVSQKVDVNVSSSSVNIVDGDQYIINISRPSRSRFSPATFRGVMIVDLHTCSSRTVDESNPKAQISNDLRLLPRLSAMFTGRTDVLQRLDDFFVTLETSVGLRKQRVFVLYGLGGVGKSQIALKFIEEHPDQWVHNISFWL